MATQVSPGVRITELDNTLTVAQSGPPAGAIAGAFRWGPVEEVRTVASEDELVRVFGKPDNRTANYFFTAANFLAYSNTLRVVRVVDATKGLAATASSNATRFGSNTYSVTSGNTTLVASGNVATVLYAGLSLKLLAGANTETVTIASVSGNGTHATLVSAPTQTLSTANAFAYGLYVKNRDDYDVNFANGTTSVGMWSAKHVGALGNTLRVELCGSQNAFSLTYPSTSNLTSTSGNTQIAVSADVTATLQVGDIITANNQDRRVLAVNTSVITVNAAFTGVFSGSSFTRKWAYATNFGSAPGTSEYVSALGGSDDEVHVLVIDEDGEFSGAANTVLEVYPFLSKARDAKTATGASNYYKEVINRQSPYLWWLSHPDGASNWGSDASGVAFAGVPLVQKASLVGGVDGTAVSSADVMRGYDVILPEQVEVSFLLAGPADTTVANHLIGSILPSKPFAMVFLSPEYSDVVSNGGNEAFAVEAFRNSLPSTSYAFMDSGWKYQYDKYNDVYRYVPLNGDVAGCSVRTDQSLDPWFSPAGFTRGQIKNVVKLAWNPSQADRDRLYSRGVNPVVTFPGQGTVLYGDKTLLSKPSAFGQINVRRLFITLQRVVDRAAKELLFDQNDEYSQTAFKNAVEPYLRQVKARRGIEEGVVVCDASNNPADARLRGELRADIYVKPIGSINYIQLNITAVRSDVAFNEIITNLQ